MRPPDARMTCEGDFQCVTTILAGRTNKYIHDFPAISLSAANSTIKMMRAGIAITRGCCIIPLTNPDLYAQEAPPAGPQYIQLSYEQLNQLVGTLRSTPQENVVYRQGYIVVQPVDPAVVYVPLYDPWIVYGAPVPVYPAYYAPPSLASSIAASAAVGFAAGVAIGAFTLLLLLLAKLVLTHRCSQQRSVGLSQGNGRQPRIPRL